MPGINILDSKTVSKIAAGEVVERPLSVVKELVENAIDAGSTEISVELEEGGHRLVRISDNGCGMSREDAVLCVRSHTTSKLSDIHDLEKVMTMGFRGEALHSIGAVAHLSITTFDGEGDVGWKVRVEGGDEQEPEPVPRVKGTTVEVENIFYNVPARRKFLKTPRSEITQINSIMTRFLVSHPAIGFKLDHNGKNMLNVRPCTDRMERIEYIMGGNIAREVVRMTASLKNLGLDAYFTMPDMTFPNRKYQLFFVNGRAVRDRNMTVAVDTAYKGLLGGGRYALAILFLDIPSDMVDVNVHPTKSEVRFVKPHDIHSLVYRTLRGKFVEPEGAGRFTLVQSRNAGVQTPARDGDEKEPEGMMDFGPSKKKHADILSRALPVQKEAVFTTSESVDNDAATHEDIETDPALDRDEPFAEADREKGGVEQKTDAAHVATGEEEYPRQIKILGQFYETFIMAEVDGTPVFVDQHVASERIIYNQLKRRSIDRHSQLMLISEPVEVPRNVFDILSANLDKIKSIGVGIEVFGDRAFVIRSVVHNAGPFDPVELLVGVAEEISALPGKAPADVLMDKLYVVASCKMAVKAGQKLEFEEMQQLVTQLMKEEYNRTCPHGRPIFHAISLENLKTWFKR